MKDLLWLDDIRNPYINEEGKVPTRKNGKHYNISWVLNYEQFIKWIELFGLPDAISFDHDLADEHYRPEYSWDKYEEKTGMDCAKWLVDYCMDNNKKMPEIFVHSANPVGADNIKGLLDNYINNYS
jgi:hypothetical protein